MSLMELQVRNAKPKEKAYKLHDGQGLYLYVSPNGSRLWRMKYYLERKEKLLSFGPYPAVSLATAREKRTQAKESLSQGIDPMITSKASTVAPDHTFEAIARRWHENRESSLDLGVFVQHEMTLSARQPQFDEETGQLGLARYRKYMDLVERRLTKHHASKSTNISNDSTEIPGDEQCSTKH